jgi:hypothetical protein
MLELIPQLSEFPEGARFSSMRHRRHILWRTWNIDQPLVLFIGINPSTADELKNDPTITRLTKILKSWEYGGFFMGNLSSIIDKNPKNIREPGGAYPIDDEYLSVAISLCDVSILMWGNEGERFIPRIEHLKSLFPVAYCFGQNKNGHPRHPLYVAEKDLHLKPFNWDKL